MRDIRAVPHNVDVDTMNIILRYNLSSGRIPIFDKYSSGDNKEVCFFIYDALTKFHCYGYYESKFCDWWCFKDGNTDLVQITGPAALRSLSLKWQVPHDDVDDEFRTEWSAAAIIGYNPLYNNTRQPAIGYDLNTAFWANGIKEWIDTTEVLTRIEEPLHDDEVGFDVDLHIVRSGYALFAFKKCPVPQGVLEWVQENYAQKQNWSKIAKESLSEEKATEAQKHKAYFKQKLNFSVGQLQNVNLWLRAWIIGLSNEYMESMIDDNTLFWNTDSIVSRVPRPDIEANLGDGLGQWKIEHTGVVAYSGNSYQWNDDLPIMRGVPKSSFVDKFDLLKDPLPPLHNIYRFNTDTIQLEVIDYENNI